MTASHSHKTALAAPDTRFAHVFRTVFPNSNSKLTHISIDKDRHGQSKIRLVDAGFVFVL